MIKCKNCSLVYSGLLFVILLLSFPAAAQQDNHLSQFYAMPMTLNPATTGMFDGNYRAHIHYRTQWASIIKNPFITQEIAYDAPKNKFGYGGYLMNTKAGAGSLQALSVVLSGSYEITDKDPSNYHHLTSGVQLGFINKSVNISNLTFDNQYSTANGGGFDPSIASTESFQKTSSFSPELNFGVYYYNTNLEKKIKPYIGMSGMHLTTPLESFLQIKNSMPWKYVAVGGAKIKINELLNIEPSILFMQQTNVHEINIGAIGYYYMAGSNAYFLMGAYYRNHDAIILNTGFLYKEYVLRLSYDVNTSSLFAYSKGRGGFEISITYKKNNKAYAPSF